MSMITSMRRYSLAFVFILELLLMFSKEATANGGVVCNLNNWNPSILNIYLVNGKGRAWFNNKNDNNPVTSIMKGEFAIIRIRWDNGDAKLIMNITTGEASYNFVYDDGRETFTTGYCPIR